MIYSRNKNSNTMKYVKLFESWLNTINEAEITDATRDFIVNDGSYLQLDRDKKDPKYFQKTIETAIKKLFAPMNSAEEDEEGKFNIRTEVRGSKVSITRIPQGDTFSFDATSTNRFLENVKVGIGSNTIFNLLGSARVSNEFEQSTTFSQFIAASYDGEDLSEANVDDCNKAMDKYVYMTTHNGKPPKVVKGSSKKIVARVKDMKVSDFFELTIEKRADLLSQAIGPKYYVVQAGDNDVDFRFDIRSAEKKKANVAPYEDDSYGYLTIPRRITSDDAKELNVDESKYADMSLANLVITLKKNKSLKDASSNRGFTPTNITTLGILALETRNLQKKNFAFSKSNFISHFEEACKMTPEKIKEGEDAWKKNSEFDMGIVKPKEEKTETKA